MTDHLKDLLAPIRLPGHPSPSPLSLPKAPDGSSPHPGHVIQAVRQARGVTLEELAAATGFRRRDKTLKRLQRLESDGAPPSPSCAPGRRYGSGWTQLLEVVLRALEIPTEWLTDVSDRLATASALQSPPARGPAIHLHDKRWRNVSHAPLPSPIHQTERSLLRESLGFLMENRALVDRDSSLYFLRPAEALLVLNPPPP
ncbi:MAG: helix-turn-helix transcriptional regulator, partial [Myxococcota bacterium]|nr:helix-turn-helix transcriptional regulator [Myxococcota bacterium]